MSLRERISEDVKHALKSGEKQRLAALRLLLAAVKQREVDTRMVLDDTDVISVIEKMQKQRRDSIAQYRAAKRDDLADSEQFEMDILSRYLPKALTAAEIDTIVTSALAQANARVPSDMGRVVALLKPQVAGRADMAEVSRRIKAQLSN